MPEDEVSEDEVPEDEVSEDKVPEDEVPEDEVSEAGGENRESRIENRESRIENREWTTFGPKKMGTVMSTTQANSIHSPLADLEPRTDGSPKGTTSSASHSPQGRCPSKA